MNLIYLFVFVFDVQRYEFGLVAQFFIWIEFIHLQRDLKKIIIVHFFNSSLGDQCFNLEYTNLKLDLVKVLAWSGGGTKEAYLVFMFELCDLSFKTI